MHFFLLCTKNEPKLTHCSPPKPIVCLGVRARGGTLRGCDDMHPPSSYGELSLNTKHPLGPAYSPLPHPQFCSLKKLLHTQSETEGHVTGTVGSPRFYKRRHFAVFISDLFLRKKILQSLPNPPPVPPFYFYPRCSIVFILRPFLSAASYPWRSASLGLGALPPSAALTPPAALSYPSPSRQARGAHPRPWPGLGPQ